MNTTTLNSTSRSIRHTARALLCSTTLASLLTACSGAAGTVSAPAAVTKGAPTTASTLREFTSPAQYKVWWELTKECSGLSRDVSGVRWYSTPDTALRTSEDGASGVAGEWTSATNSIQLVQDHINDGSVVRHEMLHALLVAGGHPASKFAGDCAGYVNCVGSCAKSVGDAPVAQADAPRVTTDSLVISQRIVPARIDMTQDPDGWFAMVVEVKNTRNYAVWVRLKAFPGRTATAATFGFVALNSSQQAYVNGDSISFLPGETKRMVFDLKAKDYVANYRTKSIRGFFNTDTLPAQTLNIVE